MTNLSSGNVCLPRSEVFRRCAGMAISKAHASELLVTSLC